MRVLLAIAAIAAAFIAGCGDGDETTTAASTSTTSSVESTTVTQSTAESTTQAEDQDGSSGGVAAESPGADPESALEAFFISGDPDLVCGELATEKLITSAYGDEKGCRQAQAPGAAASSIEIKEIEVTDDAAEAIVIPEGGPNDGFEHEVKLVYERGAWRVDSLEADIPAGP